MRFILAIFFILSCGWSEDFITPLEYGKMLYQNPRGIGCDKCHGMKGQGKIIAYYRYKKEIRKLVAPPIYNIPQRAFIGSLNKQSKVMPKYFLTKYEMKSLYDYIQSMNKNKYIKGKK